MPRRNGWTGWRDATERALYGPAGFALGPEGPAGHFRTSVHASPLFAAAVGRLLGQVDDALGRPHRLSVVDVGAGRGELLGQVRSLLPAGLRSRVDLHAVELAGRPADLPGDITWSHHLPADVVGLVLANEWLDTVPVDVAVSTRSGPRLLQVDPATGRERVGGPLPPEDAAWLARWWPLPGPDGVGRRAEVGRPRDEAWAGAVRRLRRGVAVAVDYGHLAADRRAGLWSAGTLTGYRDGRAVPPVPDGSCDVTAHVAVDAVAAAGAAAGATATSLTTQRSALGELLRELGADGDPPDPALARCDGAGYARRLARSGEVGELLDPAGLGGFHWLLQAVGVPLPGCAHPPVWAGAPSATGTAE